MSRDMSPDAWLARFLDACRDARAAADARRLAGLPEKDDDLGDADEADAGSEAIVAAMEALENLIGWIEESGSLPKDPRPTEQPSR